MVKLPKIRGVLTEITSKIDINGNIYRAFRYIDTMTGKGCVAQSDSADAIPHALYPDNPMQVLCQSQQLPKREFMRLVKDWPQLSCDRKGLAKFIRSEIDKA